MRLGGEVHDVVGLRDERPHDRGVADVALHETEARVLLERREVREIPRVRELVDDRDLVAPFLYEEMSHEVGSDETGAARDEHAHGGTRAVAGHGPLHSITDDRLMRVATSRRRTESSDSPLMFTSKGKPRAIRLRLKDQGG